MTLPTIYSFASETSKTTPPPEGFERPAMDSIAATPTEPQPNRTNPIKRPPPASIRELECKLRDAKKQYKTHVEAGGNDTDFVLKEIVVTVPKTRAPTLVVRLMTTLTSRSVASFLVDR